MGHAAARFSEQQTHAHIWPHGARRCLRSELCVRNQEPTTVCPSGPRGRTQVPLAQSCVGAGAACAQDLDSQPGTNDSLPEWSKGVDSSSTSASCVGSNPTAARPAWGTQPHASWSCNHMHTSGCQGVRRCLRGESWFSARNQWHIAQMVHGADSSSTCAKLRGLRRRLRGESWFSARNQRQFARVV